jgi:hypothetical protein
VGLALLEAIMGYVWLLSALDKLLSPTFRSGLGHQLQVSMQGNPNAWYVAFIDHWAIPHAQLCAVLVEGGELLVALGLFAGAALWLSGRRPVVGWPQRLNAGVIAALAGGAVMTANYYLMAGNTLPGLNPSAPFTEGLSIDGLLTLVALALLIVHGASMRGSRPVMVRRPARRAA